MFFERGQSAKESSHNMERESNFLGRSGDCKKTFFNNLLSGEEMFSFMELFFAESTSFRSVWKRPIEGIKDGYWPRIGFIWKSSRNNIYLFPNRNSNQYNL